MPRLLSISLHFLLLSTLLFHRPIQLSAQAFPTVTEPAVGFLAGEFEVDANGSATYSLPIASTPGTAAMVPALSLEYNSSNTEDGLLGRGWSLSGFSAVARCPATPTEDGFARIPHFDQYDRFCLDGQRLRLVSGTYAAAGSEYRLQNDASVKVVVNGQQGTGPLSFTVYKKNGQIYEYGVTSDSRLEVQGIPSVISWQLSQVRDRRGNYYNLSYIKDAVVGELVPNRIDFTGNQAAALSPYNSLRFYYQTRSIPTSSWISGVKISSTRRLKSIYAYAGAAWTWGYNLVYDSGGILQESHLASVSECNTSNLCFATRFTWGSQPASPLAFSRTANYQNLSPTQGYFDAERYPVLTGDWDGDGKTDFARVRGSIAQFLRSTDSGPSAFSQVALAISHSTLNTTPILVGDWDGDARSDFAQVDPQRIVLYRATGQGFTQYSSINFRSLELANTFQSMRLSPIFVGDWDADGRSDLMLVTSGSALPLLSRDFGTIVLGQLSALAGSSSEYLESLSLPVFVGDWNGDGLSDIAKVRQHAIDFYRSNGVGLEPLFSLANFAPAQGFADTIRFPVVTGDWNADGLVDFGRVSGDGLILCDSTGTGLNNCRKLADFSPAHGYTDSRVYPLVVGDWNADGITDIARPHSTGTRFYSIKEGSFSAPIDRTVLLTDAGYTPSIEAFPLLLGDWNGDGFTDLGKVGSTSIAFETAQPSRTGLIVAITDSIGAKTTISYQHLSTTSPQTYTKGTNAIFPLVDVQGTSSLVSQVGLSDGLGSSSLIRYAYRGLKYHTAARRILGFEAIEISDLSKSLKTTTNYSQDSKFAGLPLSVEQRLSDGRLIQRTVNTWANRADPFGQDFPYLAESAEYIYELSGTLTSSSIRKTTVDAYNNIISLDTLNSDGARESVNSVYLNHVSNWIIGQLSEISTTTWASGAAAVPSIRKTSYVYDATRALLLRELIEPTATTTLLRKFYSYDVFGNITSTIFAAAGEATRTSSQEYDLRGQFIVRTSNSLGHMTSFEYDPRHGKATKVIDANGLITLSTWDSFGRSGIVRAADGTQARTLYTKPPSGSLSNAAYVSRRDVTGKPPLLTYYDVLGRVIREQSTGANGNTIYIDRVYDAQGRLSLSSEPYFSGDQILWTSYEYDALSRPIRITEPGARSSSIVYKGLTTERINALGQRSTEVVDSLGRTQYTLDAAGSKLSFFYDSRGNLLRTLDPAGNATQMEYDQLGNKSKLIDRDTGTTIYRYNAFSELISQTNAKGQTTTQQYDKLGRLIQRSTAEGIVRWTYDVGIKAIGNLSSFTGLHGFSERYVYDSLSRVSSVTRVIGGQTMVSTQTYDALSRPLSMTYPDGFVTTNNYNSYGYLHSVSSPNYPLPLWTAGSRNARGQLISQSYLNGLTTQRSFDPTNGLLLRTSTGTFQDLSFGYDALGNLVNRQDLKLGLSESFSYDNRNRLLRAQVGGRLAITASYDALGNITARSDVGTYRYGELGAGPHALTSISGPRPNKYTYDATGNRLSSLSGSVQYNSAGLPTQLSEGTESMTILLDGQNQRVEEQYYNSSTLKRRKLIFGATYERIIKGGTTEHINYLFNDEGAFGLRIAQSAKPTQLRFYHKDHLGSIQSITDEFSVVKETSSFDAWGVRRDPQSWAPAASWIAGSTDRGYTGHEQLDSLKLIHMNGRVYDPVVGRFLSADPFIQNPKDLQSLNRYSYVGNNPLSFTDPSGYFLKGLFKKIGRSIKKALPVIITVAAIASSNYWLTPYFSAAISKATFLEAAILTGIKGSLVGAVGSVAGTLANGGSLGDGIKAGIRGMPTSALRAIVSFGIGVGFEQDLDPSREGIFTKVFREYRDIGKIAMHGLGGALVAKAEGGSIGSGFASGAFGEFSAALAENKGLADHAFLISVLSGGTAATLSGGKFAAGAVQASFIYHFNHQHAAGANQRGTSDQGLVSRGLARLKYGLTSIGEFMSGPIKPALNAYLSCAETVVSVSITAGRIPPPQVVYTLGVARLYYTGIYIQDYIADYKKTILDIMNDGATNAYNIMVVKTAEEEVPHNPAIKHTAGNLVNAYSSGLDCYNDFVDAYRRN